MNKKKMSIFCFLSGYAILEFEDFEIELFKGDCLNIEASKSIELNLQALMNQLFGLQFLLKENFENSNNRWWSFWNNSCNHCKRLNKNIEIDIFDANKSIGKKILASGNGRCNISNTINIFKKLFRRESNFVDFALKEFDFKAFLRNFAKLLVFYLILKKMVKVYPLSNEAKSVTNLFSLALEELNVNIFCEHFVQKVEKKR